MKSENWPSGGCARASVRPSVRLSSSSTVLSSRFYNTCDLIPPEGQGSNPDVLAPERYRAVA
jgi:hypothetical protein